MKVSRYNLIFEHEDKKLAFNSSSCALAEVDEDFLRVLSHCEEIDSNDDSELIKNMKAGNYIVEDGCDELEQLKMLNYMGKFGSKGLGLVLAPTLSCNFACPYCYESPTTGFMSTEVQKAVFRLVEEASENKQNVSITWYGGEPLVARELVFNMSEKFIDICRRNGVNYSASMVTNGYLVNDSIVEDMVKARITSVQVTIDGPEDIHNSRRKLKIDNGKGTFNQIIENIKKMIAKNIYVSIRVNIDKTNSDRIEELLDILKLHHLEKCNVNLGHVKPYTDKCSSIANTCLNIEEYADIDMKYHDLLHSKGFESSAYPHYPSIKHNYCCADSISSFVIDPEGNMYKCWNDTGNVSRKVGNVLEKDSYFNSLHIKYLLSSPFENEECIKCEILPICMGGCPYEKQKKGKPDCEKWLYNLIDVLKFTYKKSSSCK